jgi:hypothetical protein
MHQTGIGLSVVALCEGSLVAVMTYLFIEESCNLDTVCRSTYNARERQRYYRHKDDNISPNIYRRRISSRHESNNQVGLKDILSPPWLLPRGDQASVRQPSLTIGEMLRQVLQSSYRCKHFPYLCPPRIF